MSRRKLPDFIILMELYQGLPRCATLSCIRQVIKSSPIVWELHLLFTPPKQAEETSSFLRSLGVLGIIERPAILLGLFVESGHGVEIVRFCPFVHWNLAELGACGVD